MSGGGLEGVTSTYLEILIELVGWTSLISSF